MNTYHVTLLVQEILGECIDQVSLDFQALRAAAGTGTDKSYDDYTLSSDNKGPFAVEFQSVAAELCTRFTGTVNACALTEDRFSTDITIARCMPRPIVERMLKDYMKAGMLAWWYRQRNPDMWQKQTLLTEAAGERLQSAFTPSCTTRKLRYF